MAAASSGAADVIKGWMDRSQSRLDELAKADPADVQAIAASQLGLLASFYEIALFQARRSFRWALVAATVGVAFFMAAIILILASDSHDAATISAISGGIVEVIAGLNFALYGKTTAQLVRFHDRLEQTQRYLLANSICETIAGDDAKNAARSRLIETIALGRTAERDARDR